MSCMTVYKLTPGAGYEELEEMRNGNGSAPVVWSAMTARYLTPGSPNSWLFSRTDDLWKLWRREDIPQALRAVLGMTYDNTYVERAHYARAAADIRAFLAEFPADAQFVNHWPRIAEIFESAPDCDGIGFNWTSVNENPFQGPWDEDLEEYGPTDWSKKWSFYLEFDRAG